MRPHQSLFFYRLIIEKNPSPSPLVLKNDQFVFEAAGTLQTASRFLTGIGVEENEVLGVRANRRQTGLRKLFQILPEPEGVEKNGQNMF